MGLGWYGDPDGHFLMLTPWEDPGYVNRQHHRAFDWVISLMVERDKWMRITDLMVLKALFKTALEKTLEDYESAGHS
jgi:hypothetical protein